MYVLGISCYYHDSSAALIKDGLLLAAAQEERFTRKKHDTSFPINSIKYCLKSQNISKSQVDHIAFYEKPLIKLERVLYQHIQSFPFSIKTFLSSMPSWLNEKLRVVKKIKKELKYDKDIFFVEHHMAHAASSFLISPFKRAAICTLDGVGEWATTSCGVGDGNKIMGLSPYGNMDKQTNPYYKKLKEVIDIKEDGSYHLDMDYFIYHFKDRMPSKKLCILLGGPVRKSESELTQRHKDIAAALQLIYEEVLMRILNQLYKDTQCENIVIGGGCGLNSVANGKILGNTPFKNIWLQPDPGDGGTSIGAAYYLYNIILDNKRNFQLEDAYLGPSFSDEEIKGFLDRNHIKYSEFKDVDDLVKKTANLIIENNVIGWFQGGMEWGPRALGARSILSNPCNPNMQEILNLKVKHREKFRPFAPVVCEDDASYYFCCDKPIPFPTDFMLMVYPVKKEWQKKIPAVTHVDGSGRLQTIRRKQNSLYYDLIKEFGKLSGVPILINTSFNIRGEPIVCTPFDAYKCMMGTGIDALVMGNFIIKRDDNPKDIWDSEKYAKD